ncbi:granzyme A-like isoform X2 [Hyperolius riggenbachi]
MALLETRRENKIYMCAGCLIRHDWVLSAAHCRFMVNATNVTLGVHSVRENESEKQRMKVINLFQYKPYSPSTKRNDIQLLQLSKKAELGKAVNILHLPEAFEDLKENTVCQVAGWGKTERGSFSDRLREVNVTILDREQCKKDWRQKYLITPNMMCTNVGSNGKDTCQGDSGSPLVCNGVLRAVNSFGHTPCGTPHTSNVYTRLTENYVSWIKETIRNSSQQQSMNSKF